MIDAEILSEAGRLAKRIIRESASSKSRKASGKAGYLKKYFFLERCKLCLTETCDTTPSPLFNDVIQSVFRLFIVLERFRNTPFFAPDRPAKLFRKGFVFSKFM